MDRTVSLKPAAHQRGITLIEVLIAISLLSLIALGLTSIELFTRNHVTSSSRRAKLQNEISYALTHISKSLVRAIGNIKIDHVDDDTILTDIIDTYTVLEPYDPFYGGIKIYCDGPLGAPDGKRGTGDYRVAYRFRNATASPATERYRLEYCAHYISGSPSNVYEVIANQITAFSATVAGHTAGDPTSGSNIVNLSITACWDPTQAHHACGSPDNPSITMNESVYMPSVSTN